MSGGVDSAVTAALLKKQGFDVMGITMQLWPADLPSVMVRKRLLQLDRGRGRGRTADKLDIPYYVINF